MLIVSGLTASDVSSSTLYNVDQLSGSYMSFVSTSNSQNVVTQPFGATAAQNNGITVSSSSQYTVDIGITGDTATDAQLGFWYQKFF